MTDALGINEFAALGIRGLKSHNSVRKYRQAWQHAIDEGWAEPAEPGKRYVLPDEPFEFPKIVHAKGETPPAPAGIYETIVIDPPWPMQVIERDCRPESGDSQDATFIVLLELPSGPESRKSSMCLATFRQALRRPSMLG